MAISRSVGLVAVGVDKTPGLKTLAGAASGATAVANWLKLNQEPLGVTVQCTVISDADGKVVSAREVKDAAQKFVDDRAVDVLILYFAAHGIIKSVGEEHVLLTEVSKYNYEAINIAETVENARTCGIGHVIIVSDACRTPIIAGGPLDRVVGIAAIESGALVGGNKAPVDVFYATEPTRPAIEADGVGFFTGVLLKVLSDCPGDICDVYPALQNKRPVVPSYKLGEYLDNAVPLASRRNVPPFNQRPDIRVLSHPPTFFSYSRYQSIEEAGGPGVVTPLSEPGKRGGADSPRLLVLDRVQATRDLAGLPLLESTQVTQLLHRAGVDHQVLPDPLEADARRVSFETRTGYLVLGAKVDKVLTQWVFKPQLVDTGEGTDVRLYPPSPVVPNAVGHRGSMVVMFKGGTLCVLPVMPGYIGVLQLVQGRLESISFQLSENEQKFLGLSAADVQQARQRRAIAASLAASGKLWRLGTRDAIAQAEYLRTGKRMDPTLGIYGAYAHSLAGNDQGVSSIYYWFAQKYFDRPNDIPIAPVPFDVAMLAGKVTPKAAREVPGFAPFCPLMTLGWSYVEASTRSHALHDAILRASKYRLSAEWTTFDRRDVRPMITAFERGEIL